MRKYRPGGSEGRPRRLAEGGSHSPSAKRPTPASTRTACSRSWKACPGERGSSAQPIIKSACRSPCRPSAMTAPRAVTVAANQPDPNSSTACQGNWVNGGSVGLSDEGLAVGGVPAGALAAVLEADGRRRLAQQLHRHVPGHGHVGGRVAGPEPGEVVAKDHVRDPVQPVLDPPVPADGAGEGGGVEPG